MGKCLGFNEAAGYRPTESAAPKSALCSRLPSTMREVGFGPE